MPMSKAVSAFLDRGSFDARDNLAKRALRAFGTLAPMLNNAYDRGDERGFLECQRGLDCALHAFACINSEREYPFAGDVHPAIVGLSEACKDIREASKFAGGLLEQAEAVVHALQGTLTPVCTISGVRSVAIYRGAHCERAFASIAAEVANDH
ncbi:MAG: hypothetical protein KGS72_25855 [Cyanobacteria bacterium REEB67]|nr:hypothetical protein [Cyanobacteria bacterium REEB67]